MICPHCEYEHGWNARILNHVDGAEGDFFRFNPTMYRKNPDSLHGHNTATAVACPRCSKMFIDLDSIN